MERSRSSRPGLTALLACFAFLAQAAAQSGDGYDLTWNTIDAGGGTSSNALNRIDGTAGQPDATIVTLTGGQYSLTGGFAAALIGTASSCAGDCNGDASVTIDELVIGVNVSRNPRLLDRCRRQDIDGNGMVTVDELITAVNNALDGCSA